MASIWPYTSGAPASPSGCQSDWWGMEWGICPRAQWEAVGLCESYCFVQRLVPLELHDSELTVPLGHLPKVQGNSDSSECVIFPKGSLLWAFISQCPSVWLLPEWSYAQKLQVEPGAVIGFALWFSRWIFIAVAVMANCLIVIGTWSAPFLQNLAKETEQFCCDTFLQATRAPRKPDPQEGFPPSTWWQFFLN